MKILNCGLMCPVGEDNGFTIAMRKVATNGYMQMPCYEGSFNRDLLQASEEFKPDIIFIQIQQENILHEDTAIKLAQNSFVINFSGDVREALPDWYVHIGKHIQLTTFTNMVDVNRVRNYGLPADYLEVGFNPEIYNRHNIPKSGPEIVAHFNHYENMFPLSEYRVRIVQKLHEVFGDKFGVFGNFPCAQGNFNSNQLEEAQNYNRAKIAINCSHFNFDRYSSDRLLRALGSGVMVLSHHYKNIEEDFKIGEHLEVFNDLEELVVKCQHYLAHENQRDIIANNGYNLAHRTFTFDHMAQNIINLYNKHKK